MEDNKSTQFILPHGCGKVQAVIMISEMLEKYGLQINLVEVDEEKTTYSIDVLK
jgi:hypothetical protein